MKHSMFGRRSFLLSLPAVGASTAGCFPSVGKLTVLRQAAPNPLAGVKSYALAPVTWDGFTYDGVPEAVWLATRTPEQQASFANDKVEATQKLLERLQAEAVAGETFTKGSSSSGFVLAYNVRSYADGNFAWDLVIKDADGTPVDELSGPPTGEGMWGFAPQFNYFIVVAGMLTVEYLRERYA